MGLTEVLDVLRLKHAPWLSLVTSAFALLCLTALLRNGLPSQVIGDALSALGMPSGVVRSASAAHTWMTSPPREELLSGAAVLLGATAMLRYIRAVDLDRQAWKRCRDAARWARRGPLRRMGSASEGTRYAEPDPEARAESAAAREEWRTVRAFEGEVQQRAAALMWVAVCVGVEMRGGTLMVLLAMGIAGALILLATAFADESWEETSPTLQARLLRGSTTWLDALRLFGLRAILVPAVLPGFVIATLLEPPKRSGAARDAATLS